MLFCFVKKLENIFVEVIQQKKSMIVIIASFIFKLLKTNIGINIDPNIANDIVQLNVWYLSFLDNFVFDK